jgi:hypothetical protein
MLCVKCNHVKEPGHRGGAVFLNMCPGCVDATHDGVILQPWAQTRGRPSEPVIPDECDAPEETPHLPEGKIKPVRSNFTERGMKYKRAYSD